jgi:hypothetical protein
VVIGNGTGIEVLLDATHDGTTMTDRRGETETFSMIGEVVVVVVVAGDEVVEEATESEAGIVTISQPKDEHARRA